MSLIPQKFSLVTNTVEVLRELIRKGEWRDHLPAERILCLRLQIGRSTLRKALVLLEREGLIRILHGHGSRIVQRPRAFKRRSKIVGVLRVAPPWEVSNLSLLLLAELQDRLHMAGYEVRVFTDQLIAKRHGPSRIHSYTRQVNAACWVLFYSNIDVQRWFKSEDIPTLIVGHRFPGIDLPCIDINYEATCRHATGKLLGLGHRHIALLLPKIQEASLLARERGFRRAFEARLDSDATPSVLLHEKTLEGMRRTLDSAFQKPSHPTAMIVADAWHVLTAVSLLIRSGLRVPEDVAVISTDFELFLRANVPQIAAYVTSPESFANRLSRLAIQLAKTGALSAKPNWIIPQFRHAMTAGNALS